MILVSAALVLAAIVLLIAGVVMALPFLVMWSIVVSVLSAVCLLIGALLRRHELFPAGGRSLAATPQPMPQPMHQMPQVLPQHMQQPMTQASPQMAHSAAYSGGPTQQMANPMMAAPVPGPVAAPVSPAPSMATQQVPYPGSAGQEPPERRPRPPMPRSLPGGALGPDSIVLVIPGRKRFHLPNCRQLADREIEELTLEEAREEGFTPCTACVAESVPGQPGEPAETAPGRAGSAARTDSATSMDAPTVSAPVPRPETSRPETSRPETPWSETSRPETPWSEKPRSEKRPETVTPTVATPLPSSPPVPPVVPVPSVPPASSEWSAFSRPSPTQAPTPPAPDPEPSKPEPVVAESAAVKDEKPHPFDSTVEATRPVTAKDDGEKTPEQTPERADDEIVHVLVGTRRYHRAECSLVGDDSADIETMTKTEAEEAGLTPCSACAER